MDETIFFNPGDSIGNFHDYNEAVKTAQLYRDQHVENGHVLVVKSVNGEPSFDVFLADDKVTHDHEQSAANSTTAQEEKQYTLSKKL